MSAKNPVHNLSSLKVLVANDEEGTEAVDEMAELWAQRPRTRADCLPGGCNEARPCPWYACKYHLGLEVRPNGALSVRDVDDMPQTCVLDVAEIGAEPGTGLGSGITLEEVGEIYNITKEGVRLIEVSALDHLKDAVKVSMDPNRG